jgi:probable F420-dependent oxidoreductase
MTHPFRFIAAMPRIDPEGRWRDEVRRIEDLGFSTIAVSDHLTAGWEMEPVAAMAALAEASERVRILSFVLANDFRHPAVLHKSAVTIDRLSAGRLELGLGAGWMASDYEATGLPMDPIGVRIERLEESVDILSRLFAGELVTHDGAHYRIHDLPGVPDPVQRPRPPMLLGGGGRRMLDLAARRADIVGIHARLRETTMGADAAADLPADRVAEKVGWVRSSAAAAGRSMDALELQFTVYHCTITDAPSGAQAARSAFARALGADPTLAEHSPAVLIGPLEACVERLIEWRETLGLSYLKLNAAPEAVAPLVERLSGR